MKNKVDKLDISHKTKFNSCSQLIFDWDTQIFIIHWINVHLIKTFLNSIQHKQRIYTVEK